MSYSPLLVLNSILAPDEVNNLENYFMSLSNTARKNISATNIKKVLNVSENTTMQVIQQCVENKILKLHCSVKCPECGHLIKEIFSIDEIRSINNCYACDESIQITKDDIIILYELVDEICFHNGQQSLNINVQNQFAALDHITTSWILTNLVDDFGSEELFSNEDNKKKEIIQNSKNLDNQIIKEILKRKRRNKSIVIGLTILTIILFIIILLILACTKIVLFTNSNNTTLIYYVLGLFVPIVVFFITKLLFPINTKEIREVILNKHLKDIVEITNKMDELNIDNGYRIDEYGVI